MHPISTAGEKGHETLQLVMKTIEAVFNEETMLLIKGIKGKIDAEGNITDDMTMQQVTKFVSAFIRLVNA